MLQTLELKKGVGEIETSPTTSGAASLKSAAVIAAAAPLL